MTQEHRDPYIHDYSGRYNYQTLIWADGPQLYVEFDTQEQCLSVHLCIDEKQSIFLVGDTTDEALKKVLTKKLTFLSFLRNHCENHRFETMDKEQSRPLEPKDFTSKKYWPEKGLYL